MDFGLSDEQKLLVRTVRDFLADSVPIERVRALREAGCPNDRDLWCGFAELGLAGVLVPESLGGSGLGMLDAALVSEALGHAATPSPFLSTAVIAATALSRVADSRGAPAAEKMLGDIASGDAVFGAAITELFSVREGAGVRIESGRLHGKSMMALDACTADWILVCTPAGQIAVVSRTAPGVTTTRLAMTDATRCASEVVWEGAEAELVIEGADRAIARALQAGRVALAADNFGAGESMIERAVAYAQTRQQFGRTIGSFQAVKHMCAEMVAELEPARALIWYAAHAFDALPEESALIAVHALAHTSEIGRDIASVSTQVHGGIGWTDEQNLHFWFKRLGSGRHLLGGPEALRERAAAIQGLGPAA